MPLTPMQILLEGQRDEKSMRALSDGLRNRKEVGEMMSLVGTKNQRGFADSIRGDVQSQQAFKEKGDQRAMTQGYYDDTSQYRKSALAETIRHNKEMEKARLAAAQKSASGKAPTTTTMKRAEEAVGTFTGLKHLRSTFEDDYGNNSWLPFEGEISNMQGDSIFGTQKQKDQANWWKEYRRQYELGARNTLFGSALTDSEIAAWNAANIKPNAPPDQIRTALDSMQRVQQQVLQRIAQQDAAVFNNDWVLATYGDALNSFEDIGVPGQGGGSMEYPQAAPEAPAAGSGNWADMK